MRAGTSARAVACALSSPVIACCSAASVNWASPIRPYWAGTSLLRSMGSRVAWMMVLPRGMGTPKPVNVKLQPMPRITSASARKAFTARGFDRPPLPSDNGWFSGKALLPSMDVVTGMFHSSASALSSFQAFA